MTKQEVNAIIKKLAGAYGFTTEEHAWSDTLDIVERNKDWSHRVVNFTTRHTEVDWNDEGVRIPLHFEASIATMGGSPTPEYLLEAGATIRRAARLVMALNAEKLSYTEYFKKQTVQD